MAAQRAAQDEKQRIKMAEEEEKKMTELPPTPHRCPPRQAIGLANQGNSCFFNSVVQILASTGPLTDSILRRKLHETEAAASPNDKTQRLPKEFARTVQELHSRPFPGLEDDG